MKNKLLLVAFLLFYAMPALAQNAPPGISAPPIISVDFGTRVSSVHSMAGFLHGSNADTPADDKLLPLHPALWRIGYMWMQNRDRLAKLGIPTILILSDSWGPRVPKDPDEWTGFVHAMIQNADGLRFTWDVMNEPDLSYSFHGTPAQYDAMFVAASQILHQQLGPDTRVSGPSISHYDPQRITAFLDYCLAHHARVDVLSWHELSDDDDEHAVTQHLLDARKRFVDNPVYKTLGIQKIEINEMVGPSAQYQAGEILAYFWALERGGADSACKGCWDNNCGNNTLDGLLTPDTHTPRAAWWAYKSYADTVATRVPSRPSDPRLVSFAASGDGQTASVLVGCFHDKHFPAEPLAVSLQMTGLPRLKFVGKAGRVHVKVEKISDTGQQAVTHLEVVQETDAAVARGAAAVTLPPLAPHEAYVVTLSRAL